MSGTPAPEGAPAVSTKERDERYDKIMALAEQHGLAIAEARGWANEGLSAEAVGAKIMDRYRSGELSMKPAVPAVNVKLTPKEEKQYSIVRGLQALLSHKRTGFEFEVSDQVAKELGRGTAGFFIPSTIAGQRDDLAPDKRTQLSVGGAGKGAEAKFREYGGFIDLLVAKTRVFQLGAQFMPGLQGDIDFVAQTGAGTASWGATETTNAALSSLTLALKSMAPKHVQSATTYTRKLLRQSVFSVENLVRADIAGLHARAIDFAAIQGPGTGGQPTGVINTAGIGAVVGGANGAQPTYDHVVDLETEIGIDNVDDDLAYLTTARIRGRLKKTASLANTANVPVWLGSEVNGYPAAISNQILQNQTKGTSTDCTSIVLGAWKHLLVGEWGAFEMLTDELTLGPTLVKVMSIQFADVLVRYAEAFSAMTDARP